MKKEGLYLLIFGLLFIAFSIFFTINIFLKSKSDFFDITITKETNQSVATQEPSGWSKLMSERKNSEYHYPSNEIMLSWDLVDADKKKDTLYKVTFEKLDKYQYFCLLQVLDKNGIKRFIEKNDGSYKIYLSLHSKSAAEILLKELKEYDIEGIISKYKSEIKY
ncbi:MAG: hypothetical protein QG567_244 [Campylobacterota bacterium]|nr:hypothetical protein [Campylobacterota bacterium]